MAKTKPSKTRGPHQSLTQRSRGVSPALKAAFQMAGAGQSRVVRQFFGLSADDKQAIFQRVRDGIRNGLRS